MVQNTKCLGLKLQNGLNLDSGGGGGPEKFLTWGASEQLFLKFYELYV